jgi:arylsulfatase A-like enzyme
MRKRKIWKWLSVYIYAVLVLSLLPACSAGPAIKNAPSIQSSKPNLIFILADDLGYADLSCFGSKKINTPQLDKMAQSGMRWTRFYSASAVCSPTRVSCMTGRYPLRFGVRKHFIDKEEHLPPNTVTLPRLLKKAGYATAHVGKWHLGGLNKKHVMDRANHIPGPLQHGFDHSLAMYEERVPRARLCKARRLYRDGCKHLIRNDKPAEPVDRHWTDYKTDESLMLIEKFHGQKKPFFLNLWFDVPHTPYEPAPDPYLNPYKDRAEGDDLLYRSMVTHMDASVGRIMAKLKELGIAENTLVFFTSDNGPSSQGNPGPFKGGKADLHEGGIRVPAIACWPGRIPAGSECDEFGHTNDLLPTFCQAAEVALPKDLDIDGQSLLGRLVHNKSLPQRSTVFWQMDLYKWFPQPGEKPKPYATEIARRGKWKLLAQAGKPGELFDLEKDPGETRNVLDKEPKMVEDLTADLRAWIKACGHK